MNELISTGELIKASISKNNHSFSEVAKRINISYRSLCRLFINKKKLTLELAISLYPFTNIEPHALMLYDMAYLFNKEKKNEL